MSELLTYHLMLDIADLLHTYIMVSYIYIRSLLELQKMFSSYNNIIIPTLSFFAVYLQILSKLHIMF